MSTLTAVVLGVFVAYAGLAIAGFVPADFALILLVCTIVTGAYWIAERFYFKPRLATAGGGSIDSRPASTGFARPWWLEYTAGFFPVIAAVFLLRSFVVEPFKIPSGSMIPTLLVGDLILVNKYAYGVRLPVANVKVLEVGEPKRGDVMVFRYPLDESQNYIKRVVGVPGDEIVYEDKRLTINGQPVPVVRGEDFFEPRQLRYAPRWVETLGGVEHSILVSDAPATGIVPDAYPMRDRCTYNSRGVRCRVPPGQYFMMGDNRDDSRDSRYWGFVPEKNIVGKAFFIWMNFSDPGRIGRFR